MPQQQVVNLEVLETCLRGDRPVPSQIGECTQNQKICIDYVFKMFKCFLINVFVFFT